MWTLPSWSRVGPAWNTKPRLRCGPGLAWIFMQTWSESGRTLLACFWSVFMGFIVCTESWSVFVSCLQTWLHICMFVRLECKSLCCSVMQKNICVWCLNGRYLILMILMELTGVVVFVLFVFFSFLFRLTLQSTRRIPLQFLSPVYNNTLNNL